MSNSTFANEIRTSPAITNPLSRTRSRISTRFVVPAVVGTRSIASVFLSAGNDAKYPFRAPDAKCSGNRMSTIEGFLLEQDCARNFARLQIPSCWLPLPDFLSVFAGFKLWFSRCHFASSAANFTLLRLRRRVPLRLSSGRVLQQIAERPEIQVQVGGS